MSRHHTNAHDSSWQSGSEANTDDTMTARPDEIARFLATGQSGLMIFAWPGDILRTSSVLQSDPSSFRVLRPENAMSLASGGRLGPYEIRSAIGAGLSARLEWLLCR